MVMLKDAIGAEAIANDLMNLSNAINRGKLTRIEAKIYKVWAKLPTKEGRAANYRKLLAPKGTNNSEMFLDWDLDYPRRVFPPLWKDVEFCVGAPWLAENGEKFKQFQAGELALATE